MEILDKLAYSIPSLAKAVDLSVQQVRNHINAGDIVPSYSGSKPLIPLEEAKRFIENLPTEKRSK